MSTPTIDYTTLTFDQLREPYLRAEGWACKKVRYRATIDKFDHRFEYQVVDKDGRGSYLYSLEADAWKCPRIIDAITIDSLLGPGGAMERLIAAGKLMVERIDYEDLYFSVWDIDGDILFGNPIVHKQSVSDALCRAVMIATIISHEQETK